MSRIMHPAVKSVLIFVALCALLVPGAYAQDPPSRVARLNYVSGNVSMEPAGTDDWSPAVVNRPFTTDDYLWTEDGARAELHLDNAVLRLDAGSSFGFLNLDDRITQVKLSQGGLYVHARSLEEGEAFEVDTPNAAINILRPGDYRFRVDGDNHETIVVVREGEAEVTDGSQAFTLHAGESARLSGIESMAYDLQAAPPREGFDRWCEERDYREARSESARYLPPEVIGYEDLDSNGSWRDVPDYGPVWYPRVAAGWAPYHYGHWAWIDPWGWTWVDDAPWGFAPFHYGRWAYLGGAWGWAPGPLVVVRGGPGMGRMRPVYSPALVAFVGGSNWGVSLSIGRGPAVGWVPLGPGEVYMPGYRVSRNYFEHVNASNTRIHNTVNIANIYNTTYVNNSVVQNRVVNQRFVNMAAPNAMAAMPHDAFASGRSVAQAGLRGGDLDRIRSAPSVVGPGITPTRQALAPMRGNGPVAQPPARVTNSRVVVRTPPPSPRPSPAGFRRQVETPAVGVAPPARQMPDRPRPAQIQTYPVQPAPNLPRRVESVEQPQQPVRNLPTAPPERREGFSRPTEQRTEPRTERPPAPPVEQRLAPRVEPRPAPRIEQRTEPRIERPVEQRMGPRPEPRIERPPAPQVEQRPAPRVEQRPAPRVEPRSEPRIEPQRRVEPQAAPVREEHREAKPVVKREDSKAKDK